MTTSGTVTFDLTAAQVIQYAFMKLGIVRSGGTPNANELAEALIELDAMLKSWALNGPFINTKADSSVALISATASYDLSTIKPLRILQANYVDVNGRGIPMTPFTRDEFYNLPIRTTAGIPTRYFLDPQRATWKLYTWPVLATATTEKVEFIYQRRTQDVGAATNTLDTPQEWLLTVGYSLAEALAPNYGLSDQAVQSIAQKAEKLRLEAADFDRDGIVTFEPGAMAGGRW